MQSCHPESLHYLMPPPEVNESNHHLVLIPVLICHISLPEILYALGSGKEPGASFVWKALFHCNLPKCKMPDFLKSGYLISWHYKYWCLKTLLKLRQRQTSLLTYMWGVVVGKAWEPGKELKWQLRLGKQKRISNGPDDDCNWNQFDEN